MYHIYIYISWQFYLCYGCIIYIQSCRRTIKLVYYIDILCVELSITYMFIYKYLISWRIFEKIYNILYINLDNQLERLVRYRIHEAIYPSKRLPTTDCVAKSYWFYATGSPTYLTYILLSLSLEEF